jgi:hypothetical protein
MFFIIPYLNAEQLMTKNGIEKCVGRAWKAGRKRIKKQEIPGEDIRFLYRTHLRSIPETKSLAASWFYPCSCKKQFC